MFLTRFALQNPIAVTLFYGCVFLLGMAALVLMGRSVLPPVSFPVVTIAAPYPGAAPSEIERLIVEPIEDQLDALPDLDRVSATAQDGAARISVRFRFGSNLETDRTGVQQAVDAARPNMPADLVPPVVSRDDPSQAPVLKESVSSAVIPPGELSVLVDRLMLPRLRATSGVGSVDASGTHARQLIVEPKIGPMNAAGATVLDIFNAVSRSNDLLPGGQLTTPLREEPVGVDAAASTRAQLEAIPVTLPGGRAIPLSQLAGVIDGYASQTILSHVDGDPAIVIDVTNRSDSDSVRTIANVRKTFAQLANLYPLVRFETLRTDGPFTTAAVTGVLQTLSEGIVLTVLVMLLFLHAWRDAAVAAIAIPTSLCAAFAAMWVAGFTLNVLSLMGLSLTIGILVDDSIVIIEAIARHAQMGRSGDDAALAGRRELGGAAIAITLVDVAVFLPLALMNGIVGEFMREFGLVVVFATAFSLLVSLTLTPLLASRWALRPRGPSLDRQSKHFPLLFRTPAGLCAVYGWHGAIDRFNDFERRIAVRYAGVWLNYALRHRRAVVFFTLTLCAASLVPLLAGAIPTEFSPPASRGEATVDLTLPPGTPLALTDAAAERIAAAAFDDPAVKHTIVTAGRAFNGSSDVFASNMAEIAFVLSDPTAPGNDVVERVKSLQRLVPSASIAGAGKGMGASAPIDYSVGGDPANVDVAAARLASALRANPYATDVRTSDGGIGSRLLISVDPQRALLLGVNTDDAAQTARIGTGGTLAFRARLSSGLVDTVVRAKAGEDGDLPAIVRLNVRNGDGQLVPLGDVSRTRHEEEPTIIERENRERVVSVTANAAGTAPTGLVTAPMRKLIAQQEILPPGTRIAPRGDLEQFLETVRKIFAALGLSVLAVYAILAVLYRSYSLPLVIMLTVPLASIGAFGSLFVLSELRDALPGITLFDAQTLNLYSMLGIVMLVGLVAKNGILLIDVAEKEIRAGRDAVTAIRLAAERRFRPIVMTTFAMIAGMLPLALGETIGAEYRKALGTVVIGGLSSSLLLTLFVVPVAYVMWRARNVRLAPSVVDAAVAANF